MEQIELLIKMPKQELEFIREFGIKDVHDIEEIIYNGTLLPNGHGRLIDADKFDERMYQKAFIDDSDMQKWDSGCWIRYKMYERVRDSMPTIVEADKEGATDGTTMDK